jgi:hypothetical protein
MPVAGRALQATYVLDDEFEQNKSKIFMSYIKHSRRDLTPKAIAHRGRIECIGQVCGLA